MDKLLEFHIVLADERDSVEIARSLFIEYANSLDFSLCFQGFDEELAALPGDYSPPAGRLLLATVDGKNAGCVALRRLDRSVCEMKRLYVRPEFRDRGIGRKMALEITRAAQGAGYKKLRLDTVPIMKEAIALYRSMGFMEIEPYRDNPVPGALFMELVLPRPEEE